MSAGLVSIVFEVLGDGDTNLAADEGIDMTKSVSAIAISRNGGSVKMIDCHVC